MTDKLKELSQSHAYEQPPEVSAMPACDVCGNWTLVGPTCQTCAKASTQQLHHQLLVQYGQGQDWLANQIGNIRGNDLYETLENLYNFLVDIQSPNEPQWIQQIQNQHEKQMARAQRLQLRHSSVDRLRQDLLDYVIMGWNELNATCRGAWETLVHRRLAYIGTVGGRPLFWNALVAELGHPNPFTNVPVNGVAFGQVRAAGHFQGPSNLSIQEVANKTLVEVATKIRNRTLPADLLKVQIFKRANENFWIAINNRGLACLSLAGVQLLRLIPRGPTVDENNRLNDTLAGNACPWAQQDERIPANTPGTVDRNTLNWPHTLPSRYLPLTLGQNNTAAIGFVETVAPAAQMNT